MSQKNVIPIQSARGKKSVAEVTYTSTPVDIRTSQVPARVVEDGDDLRFYPGVQFDCAVDDSKTSNARKFKSEPIAMSAEMALFTLASVYGPDTAGAMLFKADQGDYVFGAQTTHTGGGYRWRTGWNVASDKSREEGYVIQLISFRQHAKGYRKPEVP